MNLLYPSIDPLGQQCATAHTVRCVTVMQPCTGVRQSYGLPHAIMYSTLTARDDTSAEGMQLMWASVEQAHPLAWPWSSANPSLSLPRITMTFPCAPKLGNMFCQSRINQDVLNSVRVILTKMQEGDGTLAFREASMNDDTIISLLPPVFSRF